MRIGLNGRLLLRNLRGMAVYTYNVLRRILTFDTENQYILYIEESSPVNTARENYSKILDPLQQYPNLKISNVSAGTNQFLREQFFLPADTKRQTQL